MVIITNENNPILLKQIPRQIKPRVHHVQPLGMEAAIGVGVGTKFLPLGVYLPGVLQICL